MDFSVYTYGGGEVLWKVFNGIAILFQSESHYFTSIGKLTVGVSLLLVALRSIPQASLPIFFKSWFLPTTLLVALFFGPKAQVHIIDEIDTSFKHAKIDHIPLGMATVASFTSNLSKFITEKTETVFGGSDAERYSKVGPMFATKMIHQAQQLTIKDPLMRENLKDFVRQCYAWPYVFSNLNPGKRAALEAEDILEFIKANPHPLLGIYWRHPNGRTEFQNCNQCVAKVSEALQVEVSYGIQSLAGKLFSAAQDPGAPSRRLQQYFGDAWSSIAKNSSNMAQVVQQELMINSYREAIQDKRDELGLGRTDTGLLQLNAARGQANQNTTFLMKAALAIDGLVVTIHGLFFALSLIFFALVAPLTFLPQGLRLLTTWLKMMAWLATWPVMLTVLNMLGHMYASKALASELVGLSSGLTLLTQGGLSETSYNAYCWVMGLQILVPPLSWALISGGGYAFSQMASSLTQTAEGFAAKTGAEIIDGNVSFDTQSIGNRSMANMQIAQQQLSPSFNTGMRFDDGKIAAIYGPNGQITVQEHQTQLGTNITESNAFSHMAATQSQFHLSAANQERFSLQDSISTATNEAVSGIKSFATNTGTNESFGDSVSAQANKQAQDLLGLAEKIGKQNNLSTDVALKAALGANMSGSVAGGIGGGAKVGLNADGTVSTGSVDTDFWQKVKDTDEGKQFTQAWQKFNQYVHDNRGSISNSEGIQYLDNMQVSYNQATSYSKNMDAHLQTSKSLSDIASATTNAGISATTNSNDKYLRQLANERFGGSITLAAQSLVESGSTQELGNSAVNQVAQQPHHNMGSANRINEFYNESKAKVGNEPTKEILENKRQEYDIEGCSTTIRDQAEAMNNNALGHIKHASGKIGDQKANLSEERSAIATAFKDKKDQSLLTRTAGKVVNQVSSMFDEGEK